MKPSTTPKVSAIRKKELTFQCEGIDASALWSALASQTVVAYAMPLGHSFQAAWMFRLILGGGGLLEFSSTSTQVVDWQEVGSLNIRFAASSGKETEDGGLEMATIAIPTMHLLALEKLVYEDADVVSECALVLSGKEGEEIVIAVGIPPGAVSVLALFAHESFEPQFAMSMCKRERL